MHMEDVNLVLADTKANASHAGTDRASPQPASYKWNYPTDLCYVLKSTLGDQIP